MKAAAAAAAAAAAEAEVAAAAEAAEAAAAAAQAAAAQAAAEEAAVAAELAQTQRGSPSALAATLAPTKPESAAQLRGSAAQAAPAAPWGGDAVPDAFLCPLTLDLMMDPVVTSDGQTYERRSIEQWLAQSSTSPLTGHPLPHLGLAPNVVLRGLIRDYLERNPEMQAGAAISNV